MTEGASLFLISYHKLHIINMLLNYVMATKQILKHSKYTYISCVLAHVFLYYTTHIIMGNLILTRLIITNM